MCNVSQQLASKLTTMTEQEDSLTLTILVKPFYDSVVYNIFPCFLFDVRVTIRNRLLANSQTMQIIFYLAGCLILATTIG